MIDLVIVGAGGFGREIVTVVDCDRATMAGRGINLLGFVDDGSPDLARLERIGLPLLGGVDTVQPGWSYVIGVGDSAVRRSLDDRLGERAKSCRPLVHALTSIGRDVDLDEGTVVCAGVSITTNVRIGRHVHLNLAATVGHDCVLGDFVTVSPAVNISGNVTVGDGAYFGTNCSVLPGVTIGPGAVIGAGAMVRQDVPAGVTVVGVPARVR